MHGRTIIGTSERNPYPDTPWSTGLVSNQSDVAKPASAWLDGWASCADLRVGEDGFVDQVADRLAMLPTVEAVVLGGSRVQATRRPDSDLDPADLLSWRVRSPDTGRNWLARSRLRGRGMEWWVFNRGTLLQIRGRRVDAHYGDLDSVDHEHDRQRAASAYAQ